MCVLAKKNRLEIIDGKVSGNLRNVLVSDYKPLLNIGHLVLIEGEKYIIIKKDNYKGYFLGLNGSIKKLYYKYIDFLYFTVDAAKDKDVIEYLKELNLGTLSVVEYDEYSHQYMCVDGCYHSYSYLLNQYIKQLNRNGAVVYG